MLLKSAVNIIAIDRKIRKPAETRRKEKKGLIILQVVEGKNCFLHPLKYFLN